MDRRLRLNPRCGSGRNDTKSLPFVYNPQRQAGLGGSRRNRTASGTRRAAMLKCRTVAGRLGLCAGVNLRLAGFRPGLSSEWVVDAAAHCLDAGAGRLGDQVKKSSPTFFIAQRPVSCSFHPPASAGFATRPRRRCECGIPCPAARGSLRFAACRPPSPWPPRSRRAPSVP